MRMTRGRDAPPAPKPPPVFVQMSSLQSRPDDALMPLAERRQSRTIRPVSADG